MNGRALRWIVSLAHSPTGRNGAPPPGPRLTIVRHHRVYADHERPLYRLGVSESVFAAQLDLLVAHGLTPVTVSEGLERLATGEPVHAVAFSFDDGYADNVWRALPRLHAAGARGTFYLTAGLMEERRAPWWDELAHALETTREERLHIDLGGATWSLPLQRRADRAAAVRRLTAAFRVPPVERDHRLAELRMRLGVSRPATCELASWDTATALVRAGMEIGAHTLTHPHLTTLGIDAQAQEIRGSADLIERRVGVRPGGFAYPGGDYDDGTAAIMPSLGFTHAVTTRAGVNDPGTPRFELVRRGLGDGACLGPSGRFSGRLMLAELHGLFDRARATAREVAS